jgi:MFS family permease
VGSGVISDCYRPEERGFAVSVYNIVPLLGPSLGPIAGAFITQYISWRWIFFLVSIADAVLQLLAAFFLYETYVPVLLDKRRKKLAKVTRNIMLRASLDRGGREHVGALLRKSLLRSLRLLATQPILQVLAIYLAYVYGLIYLAFSTFPTLWEDQYHEPTGIGSLNYLSLGLGYISGSFACGILVDKIYKKLKKGNNDDGEPEFRIPMMALASLFVPIGLFWYGWSAQERLHWIIPNIGAFIFSAGVIIIMQCVNNYIIDAYPRYAASAIGAVTLIRNLPGTGFPLFAPYMYSALGFGWGNSILAFVAISIGLPAPLLIWKFGKRLRASSRYASSLRADC